MKVGKLPVAPAHSKMSSIHPEEQVVRPSARRFPSHERQEVRAAEVRPACSGLGAEGRTLMCGLLGSLC